MDDMPVALVTGSSHGIGRATAAFLLKEGYEVHGFDSASPTDPLDGLLHKQVDVADFAAVTAAVEEVGAIDAVVNCAGIVHRASFLETSPLDMSQVMGVNFGGAYNLTWIVARHWVAVGGGGRVVNVSSAHAVLAQKNRSAYACTKAALEAFTRNVNVELAGKGVLVFGVAPGYTVTEPGRTRLVGERAYKAGLRVPLGRALSAWEIAEGIGLLLSGKLDSMCGQVLRLDGGWSNTDVELDDLRG